MSHTPRPDPAAWVGIDVSQHTLDACLLPAGTGKPRHHAFANDPAGHAALARWATRRAPAGVLHFCLEATGPYGEALADSLHSSGLLVSVVNPARVKYHGVAAGQGNKTDRADARLIAEYARDRNPPAWQPPGPEVRQLQALVRRRDELRALAAREKTRLAQPGHTQAARRSIQRTAAFLTREAKSLQAEADTLIASTPALQADRDLLVSVRGVGPQTASTVLAELPPLAQLSTAQSAAAYAGLAPREFTSGSSVRRRTRLSKVGNARLRKALYLPTLTAIRFNPLIQAFFERLLGAGKSRMAAVGACMRKLLMICYGVLKNRTPFDANWSKKTR